MAGAPHSSVNMDPDSAVNTGAENEGDMIPAQNLPANLRSQRVLALREILASVRTVGDVVNEADFSASVLSYTVRYPAALAVRDALGHEVWGFLESYRKDLAYLAVQFLHEREPSDLHNYLRRYHQQMQQIVNDSRGYLNSVLLRKVVDDALNNEDGPHLRKPTILVREMFRRHPIFWLVYNLYYAPETRHSWDAAAKWALQNLRQQGVTLQPPAWPAEIARLTSFWDQRTLQIWNQAEIEVFVDLIGRFGSSIGVA